MAWAETPGPLLFLVAAGFIGASCDLAISALKLRIQMNALDVVVVTVAIYYGATTGAIVGALALSLGFLGTWVAIRLGAKMVPYSPDALAINAASIITAAAAAGVLSSALGGTGLDPWPFAGAAIVSALLALIISVAVLVLLLPIRDPSASRPDLWRMMLGREQWAVLSFWVALIVLSAASHRTFGNSGLAVALTITAAFAYMAQLLVQARDAAERAQDAADRNEAMSWGTLGALVRTLNARDPAGARHSAAVAMFSRDIAVHLELDDDDQRLAHLAGLFHDIGRFSMSDQTLRGEGVDIETGWKAIRRHPVVGAELLEPLEGYGPVATIVRHHHERLDGKGYPDRLKGEEIPLVSRIVAVAEVYDTLTGGDTYREQKSSFEAIRELRRVSGSQLDGRCVEALAELISGRGTEYRHADGADYALQLGLQRPAHAELEMDVQGDPSPGSAATASE